MSSITYLCTQTSVSSPSSPAGCSGIATPHPNIVTVHPVAILLSPKVGQEGGTRTIRLLSTAEHFCYKGGMLFQGLLNDLRIFERSCH